MMSHLLILDIDEVLIYSTKQIPDAKYDFYICDYYVRKRPYVDKFISEISKKYELAIWTSAGEIYADEIISILFPNIQDLKFIWCYERCVHRYDEYGNIHDIKDLRKVKRIGFDLRRVLVVDDDFKAFERNYGNLVLIKPFRGDTSDKELLYLLDYLELMQAVENVRVVEKRGWRSRYDKSK